LAYRNSRVIVAQIQVDARAEQGSQVMVESKTGQQLLKRFIPALISSRVVDEELLVYLNATTSSAARVVRVWRVATRLW
jgi:hypothetical protein